MKLSKSFVIPAVALVVGVGIGGASKSDAAPAAAAEPKTITKTVEVEVPGPERAVEKTVVPEGCTTAIAEAREVALGVADFADSASIYPPLVGQAFEAGLNDDVSAAEDIADKMKEANEGFDAANAKVRPAVDAFNAAAEQCRA